MNRIANWNDDQLINDNCFELPNIPRFSCRFSFSLKFSPYTCGDAVKCQQVLHTIAESWDVRVTHREKKPKKRNVIIILFPFAMWHSAFVQKKKSNSVCLVAIPYDIRDLETWMQFCEYFGVRVEWNAYLWPSHNGHRCDAQNLRRWEIIHCGEMMRNTEIIKNSHHKVRSSTLTNWEKVFLKECANFGTETTNNGLIKMYKPTSGIVFFFYLISFLLLSVCFSISKINKKWDRFFKNYQSIILQFSFKSIFDPAKNGSFDPSVEFFMNTIALDTHFDRFKFITPAFDRLII